MARPHLAILVVQYATQHQAHPRASVIKAIAPTELPPDQRRAWLEGRRSVGRELAVLAKGLLALDPALNLSASLLAMALSDIASRLQVDLHVEEGGRPGVVDVSSEKAP